MVDIESKSGAGSFYLRASETGEVFTSLNSDGVTPFQFASPQSAYDFHRAAVDRLSGTMDGHSHWNICYALESRL